MSAAAPPVDAAAVEREGGPPVADRLEGRVPRAGWRVIAAKELGDHLLSVRFIVLLIVLGLAAAIPLYFAADLIRAAAPQASAAPAVFLALFTIGSQDYSFLRVDSFVAIVAPLLGLAFAFDAINGERSEGTLPRLLAQPIYRDDVINGKFAAGLAVIGVVLVAVIGIIAGFGIFRLGIVPDSEEIVRLVAWIAVTFVYVGLWLAFGLLLSVLVRRAATSALIGFGVWFVLTIFGGLDPRHHRSCHLAADRVDARGADRPGADPAVHQPAAARPALLRGDRGPARSAQQPAARPARVARPGTAGGAADPDAARLRPEPAAGDAAGRGPGGADRRLLRVGLRRVHAPGSARLTANWPAACGRSQPSRTTTPMISSP